MDWESLIDKILELKTLKNLVLDLSRAMPLKVWEKVLPDMHVGCVTR